MFVQQIDRLPYDNLADNINFITKILKPTKFAGIIHNKDTNEHGSLITPHIHLVMQFKNGRSIKNLAKLINQQPQHFEKWKGSINNAYSYLIHQTNSAQNQFQYHSKEVIANFDFTDLIDNISNEVNTASKLKDSDVINNILDLLYIGEITIEDAERILSGSQYGKASSQLNAVNKKRIELLAKKWREDMKNKNQSSTVLWIYGTSSTGKTKLAKKYAKRFTDDFYFSGSSRDPFQRYNGENVIILDELRPNMMDYSDLLKMLDPYNDEVMASSRYFDKPLTANYFIITSPYSPEKFYNELLLKGNIISEIDNFEQLARRLYIVQEMTQSLMFLYFYSDIHKHFIKDDSTAKVNPYAKRTTPNENEIKDAISLYESFTEISED